MSNKNKIHFLAGSQPSSNPVGICAIFNWALVNNFEVVQVMNVMLPSTRRIVGQSQGVAIESTSFFYCSATNEAFESYFGEPYNEEKIVEYVKKIGDVENAKANLTEG